MNCSPLDLKDYFFGELNTAEAAEVERHARGCDACREELAALSATRSAMLCVAEEEPPRRIAFVSDKVFEPRWWQRILASGPQLGFASAAVLAAAIVFHAVQPPAPVVPVAAAAQVDSKLVEAEIAKRVQLAVNAAVAASEARQAERLLQVVDSRLSESDRRADVTVRTIEHFWDIMEKRRLSVKQASFTPVPAFSGDIQ